MGNYKDQDHNLISEIESYLSDALRSIEYALDSVDQLAERNPDREVMIQGLHDEIYDLYTQAENTDFGDALHEMFQIERGEDYWEDA